MATTITPLQQDHISSCLLIDLNLDGNVYYISSAYKPITYNSNTYTELGSFLQISPFSEDIKATNGDISVNLKGIHSEQDYLSIILTTKIKGGTINIYRGFYNNTTDEIDTNQIYKRFSGIITNFTIQEDFSPGVELKNSVTITCACVFFFNDTATTEIYTLSYTLSLHDALPICSCSHRQGRVGTRQCGRFCHP